MEIHCRRASSVLLCMTRPAHHLDAALGLHFLPPVSYLGCLLSPCSRERFLATDSGLDPAKSPRASSGRGHVWMCWQECAASSNILLLLWDLFGVRVVGWLVGCVCVCQFLCLSFGPGRTQHWEKASGSGRVLQDMNRFKKGR